MPSNPTVVDASLAAPASSISDKFQTEYVRQQFYVNRPTNLIQIF